MISIIIPTYKEEESIPLLLNKIKKILSDFEVIIVDDSPDNKTFMISKQVCESLSIPHKIKHRKKKGKGGAVYEGINMSSGNIIVVIDADLEYNPEYISEMIGLLDDYDVVTAVRIRRDPFYRQVLSRFFHLFVFILFGISFETQSGLKVFKKKKIDDIVINTEGWVWDVEFLYKCLRKGLKVTTYKIEYISRNMGKSKINLLTPFKMFYELIRLRFKI